MKTLLESSETRALLPWHPSLTDSASALLREPRLGARRLEPESILLEEPCDGPVGRRHEAPNLDLPLYHKTKGGTLDAPMLTVLYPEYAVESAAERARDRLIPHMKSSACLTLPAFASPPPRPTAAPSKAATSSSFVNVENLARSASSSLATTGVPQDVVADRLSLHVEVAGVDETTPLPTASFSIDWMRFSMCFAFLSISGPDTTRGRRLGRSPSCGKSLRSRIDGPSRSRPHSRDHPVLEPNTWTPLTIIDSSHRQPVHRRPS